MQTAGPAAGACSPAAELPEGILCRPAWPSYSALAVTLGRHASAASAAALGQKKAQVAPSQIHLWADIDCLAVDKLQAEDRGQAAGTCLDEEVHSLSTAQKTLAGEPQRGRTPHALQAEALPGALGPAPKDTDCKHACLKATMVLLEGSVNHASTATCSCTPDHIFSICQTDGS